MRIAIGSDHAGLELKEFLHKALGGSDIEFRDFVTHSSDSVDYSDFAHPVSDSVEQKQVDLGIVICGSANGVAMAANKHADIRCALCWNVEVAALARQHNDANVIALPARFISEKEALSMVKTFINTPFEGGRHQGRVEKI